MPTWPGRSVRRAEPVPEAARRFSGPGLPLRTWERYGDVPGPSHRVPGLHRVLFVGRRTNDEEEMGVFATRPRSRVPTPPPPVPVSPPVPTSPGPAAFPAPPTLPNTHRRLPASPLRTEDQQIDPEQEETDEHSVRLERRRLEQQASLQFAHK
ncbi:unnamed protein product [Boreogadus saida]